MDYLMESGYVFGKFFILLRYPTIKTVNDSYMNNMALNNVEEVL